MTYAHTVKFLVAMGIMMNPLGSLSIFLQMTRNNSLHFQRQTAIKCTFAILVIMLMTLWVGKDILDLLGITIGSFRVAGGIILFLVGLSMLQSQESPVTHTPEEDAAARHAAATESETIAVVPLALPIIMGPGSISTLIIASNDYVGFIAKLWLSMLTLSLTIGMGMILYYGATVAGILGDSIIKVITRIMGMIVMALAVSMLAQGIIDLVPVLAK